jgi:hypothetical protein
MTSIINFISRECNKGLHRGCHGTWEGLCLEAYCSCTCHNDQKAEALQGVRTRSVSASRNDEATLVTDIERI